jgi:hypothetical protein
MVTGMHMSTRTFHTPTDTLSTTSLPLNNDTFVTLPLFYAYLPYLSSLPFSTIPSFPPPYPPPSILSHSHTQNASASISTSVPTDPRIPRLCTLDQPPFPTNASNPSGGPRLPFRRGSFTTLSRLASVPSLLSPRRSHALLLGIRLELQCSVKGGKKNIYVLSQKLILIRYLQ